MKSLLISLLLATSPVVSAPPISTEVKVEFHLILPAPLVIEIQDAALNIRNHYYDGARFALKKAEESLADYQDSLYRRGYVDMRVNRLVDMLTAVRVATQDSNWRLAEELMRDVIDSIM